MTPTLRPPLIAAPPSLRLFSEDPSPPDSEAQDFTVRQLFESRILPDLLAEGRKPGTFEAYYWAIRHWEKRTTDPPVPRVVDQTMRDFFRQFKPPDYELSTAAKVWRQLRPIFRRAAPESDRNPEGLGILAKMPRVKLGKIPRRANRLVAEEELNALYYACDVAVWPRVHKVPPPALWRCALVSLTNLAPRSWDFFCESPRQPAENVWLYSSINWLTKTIRFKPDKTGDELRIPLHPIVIAHLESVRTERDVVFPATRNRHYVYDEWKKIKIAAGINVDGPEDLSFQQLRENCQTEWDSIKMGLGDFILGHAPQGVGATWYRNFQKKAMKACKDFPQPAAFQEIFKANPAQLALF